MCFNNLYHCGGNGFSIGCGISHQPCVHYVCCIDLMETQQFFFFFFPEGLIFPHSELDNTRTSRKL